MLKKENKVSNEHLAVLIENMNSQFKGIREGNQFLSEQVEKLDKKVDKLDGRMDGMESRMDNFEAETKSNFQIVFNYMSDMDDFRDETKNNFKKVFNGLDKIEYRIGNIKSEIADVKKTLVKKADLGRIKILEKRVKIIETELLELRAV